jgi:hypothetical protein
MDLIDANRDPRVDDWTLMSSIWPTVGICLGYVFLMKWVGPMYMKERPAYQVKELMMVYNILQIVFSGWVFIECYKLYVFPGTYSWHCQPVDYSLHPEAVRILDIFYYFYLSKFADMFDSLFMVLRKKFDHLSFLHVFHHSEVPVYAWFFIKIVGGGHSMFQVWINSGIHTIMYSYYLLSACGPRVQKYLWWKRYLTSLQILQFVVVSLHSLQPLFFNCDYSNLFAVMCAANCMIFLGLFSAFYKKAYVKKDA